MYGVVEASTRLGEVLVIPKVFVVYEVLEVVSNTLYSVIVRVRDIDSNERLLGRVMKRPVGQLEECQRITDTMRVAATIDSPYLEKVVEFVFIDSVMIVVAKDTDGCGLCDLMSLLRRDPLMALTNWKKMFEHICLGVQQLHARGIGHRNLVPETILVDSEFNCKLCDYGLASEARMEWIATGRCQRLAYLAPEVIRDDGYDVKAADIWALGVILHFILTTRTPWTGESGRYLCDQDRKSVV